MFCFAFAYACPTILALKKLLFSFDIFVKNQLTVYAWVYFLTSLYSVDSWWWFSCEVMFNSCDPMDCGLADFSIYGIFQTKILDWVAISFSRGSSWLRGWTPVSLIAGRFFTDWATREAPVDSFVYSYIFLCTYYIVFIIVTL